MRDERYYMNRADGSPRTVGQVAQDMADWIARRPAERYELVIGTDSQAFSHETKVVEAAVLRLVGRGGIFFYHISRVPRRMQLREKIYGETQRSLELAGKLVPVFHDAAMARGLDPDAMNLRVAIHCDIGNVGPTRDMLREISGWVEAQGYDCMVKPDSYAASGVANMLSK